MSVLKRLISFSLALGLCLNCSISTAQILDMSADLSALKLPAGFISSLKKCEPYKSFKLSEYKEVRMRTEYEISQTENDKCMLKVEGFTNASVHITQSCELSLEQAEEYAQALDGFQRQHFSPRFDKARIRNNLEYQRALKIMADTRLCHFVRDEIDHTAEVRQNLTACAPAVSVEEIMGAKITRKIVGEKDDKCVYSFELLKPRPDNSEFHKDLAEKATELKDISYSYECFWDNTQRETYLRILEAFVIPEEEGYDFQAVMRPTPWEEMEFIVKNCHYTTKTENMVR